MERFRQRRSWRISSRRTSSQRALMQRRAAKISLVSSTAPRNRSTAAPAAAI
ncbi:hypothetical protein [Lysobacter gummosus]|uniref:hypothetical protein n=1 Tax=Lysobacter gummosus TaxID=262324 RepID=UPI00363AE60A